MDERHVLLETDGDEVTKVMTYTSLEDLIREQILLEMELQKDGKK